MNEWVEARADDDKRLLETTYHPREAWLYANPEALFSVMKGLEESAHGKAVSIGSFARYADDVLDEETP